MRPLAIGLWATSFARDFLRRSGAAPREMHLFLLELALEIVGRRGEDRSERLADRAAETLAWLGAEQAAVRPAGFWPVVDRLCGHPVLSLFLDVLAPPAPQAAHDEGLRAVLLAAAGGDLPKCRRLLQANAASALDLARPG